MVILDVAKADPRDARTRPGVVAERGVAAVAQAWLSTYEVGASALRHARFLYHFRASDTRNQPITRPARLHQFTTSQAAEP